MREVVRTEQPSTKCCKTFMAFCSAKIISPSGLVCGSVNVFLHRLQRYLCRPFRCVPNFLAGALQVGQFIGFPLPNNASISYLSSMSREKFVDLLYNAEVVGDTRALHARCCWCKKLGR